MWRGHGLRCSRAFITDEHNDFASCSTPRIHVERGAWVFVISAPWCFQSGTPHGIHTTRGCRTGSEARHSIARTVLQSNSVKRTSHHAILLSYVFYCTSSTICTCNYSAGPLHRNLLSTIVSSRDLLAEKDCDCIWVFFSLFVSNPK